MVEKGETCVSHVAMLSAKITTSNAQVLIEGLKNKSTRELRDFVATVNADGSIKRAKNENLRYGLLPGSV